MGSVNIKNYDTGKESTINAHQNMLSCISLSSNGSLLATASEKGTLIRVYNTSDGTLLKELRRGTENAEIYSIAFEPSGKFIACSSDRKTIHIFILGADGQNPTANGNKGQNVGPAKEEQEEPKNHKSVFGKITNFFGVQNTYFNSEWSFAQFRITDTKAICSFGPDNSIIVISSEGKYYQAEYDPKNGGECTNIQETDLAGHSQDSQVYRKVLERADKGIEKILPLLTEDDILIIQADHGNDPDIGSSRHTRECVPLLIYKKGVSNVNVGTRRTMSDNGATCCDYFNVEKCENGTSYLDLIK